MKNSIPSVWVKWILFKRKELNAGSPNLLTQFVPGRIGESVMAEAKALESQKRSMDIFDSVTPSVAFSLIVAKNDGRVEI